MKQKLVDFPARWGYYLTGLVAVAGLIAWLMNVMDGIFFLILVLPIFCIAITLVLTLRQHTVDIFLPLLMCIVILAALRLCYLSEESDWNHWLSAFRLFVWPSLLTYGVTAYLVLHWHDRWCRKSCWLCYVLVAAVSFLLPWLAFAVDGEMMPYFAQVGVAGNPALWQLLMIPAICLVLGIWFPVRQKRVDFMIPLLVFAGYYFSMIFHLGMISLYLARQMDYCTLALILYLVPGILFKLMQRRGRQTDFRPEVV